MATCLNVASILDSQRSQFLLVALLIRSICRCFVAGSEAAIASYVNVTAWESRQRWLTAAEIMADYITKSTRPSWFFVCNIEKTWEGLGMRLTLWSTIMQNPRCSCLVSTCPYSQFYKLRWAPKYARCDAASLYGWYVLVEKEPSHWSLWQANDTIHLHVSPVLASYPGSIGGGERDPCNHCFCMHLRLRDSVQRTI